MKYSGVMDMPSAVHHQTSEDGHISGLVARDTERQTDRQTHTHSDANY